VAGGVTVTGGAAFGTPPKIDMAKFRLKLDGKVDNPLELTYDEVLAYPAITRAVLRICSWIGVDNAEWTGVPLATLLEAAGVSPEATQVTFYAADGYSNSMPLSDVMRDGVFVAYEVNGEVLPKELGYPLRLVVSGELGGHWVQWLTRIEVGG